MNRSYYVAIALYCAFIFWLSHQSDPPGPDIGFPGLDKLAHMVLFGGLAGLVSLGLHRAPRPVSHRTLVFAPILVAAIYGGLDEFHQFFTPDRTPSLLDWLADIAGAGLASGAIRRIAQWQARRLAPELDET